MSSAKGAHRRTQAPVLHSFPSRGSVQESCAIHALDPNSTPLGHLGGKSASLAHWVPHRDALLRVSARIASGPTRRWHLGPTSNQFPSLGKTLARSEQLCVLGSRPAGPRIPGGGSDQLPPSSITSTSLSGSNWKVSADGSWLRPTCWKEICVSLPNRSTIPVATTSPVASSTVSPNRS